MQAQDDAARLTTGELLNLATAKLPIDENNVDQCIAKDQTAMQTKRSFPRPTRAALDTPTPMQIVLLISLLAARLWQERGALA
jgi:hypothetical protein